MSNCHAVVTRHLKILPQICILKYKLKFLTQINLTSQDLTLLIKNVNLKRLKIFEESSVDTIEVSTLLVLFAH